MRFSLDSNAVIALMKGQRQVLDRLREHGVDSIGLGSIVIHELHFGARKSRFVAENIERLQALPFKVMNLDLDDAVAAAEIQVLLRQAGTPIGQLDTLIAGQALARDLTLVTHNTHEFQRVPGLRIVDWQ